MNTHPETFVPPMHCIINDIFVPSDTSPLSDAASVHRRHEVTIITNVSMHASMPKDILA